MKIVRILIAVVGVALLIGCSEWPPYKDDIRENLFENREIFEELENVLDTNGYGLIRGRNAGSIQVGYESNGTIEYDYIDDDKGWGELLSKAKVMDISRNEDVYFFTTSGHHDDNAYTSIQYIHHPNADSVHKICVPSHREIPCGACVAKLDDEWWAYYKWAPNDLGRQSSDAMDALLEGEISEEQYDQQSEQEIDSCWRDGYSRMGYEILEDSER